MYGIGRNPQFLGRRGPLGITFPRWRVEISRVPGTLLGRAAESALPILGSRRVRGPRAPTDFEKMARSTRVT